MTQRGLDLDNAIARDPHLREYIKELKKTTNLLPKYFENLSVGDLAEIRKNAILDPTSANIIYKIGGGHIHIDALRSRYITIEARLNLEEKEMLRRIKDLILEKAALEESVETKEDLVRILGKLFDQSVEVVDRKSRIRRKRSGNKVVVDKRDYELLKYYINRDIVGYGPIEPLIMDPYIEDIHLIGTSRVRVSHKAFQYGLETNVRFDDEITLNEFFISMSERMGRPVSASRPIVDGTLPDGSRINMIYSTDISARGSSFTIRKFAAEPISPIQLIKWGTLSPELVAYIWLCLENKMNIILAGETASGKTTTLNALLCFIDHRGKIYSVEDTPEVKPPQRGWQRCVTREAGPEDARVTMFDLLRAALRSRPDYIVIGEIRGEEGRVAFQCMQTGIPVLSTFHASSASKFIQRMTGQPINIPMSFIDNVNVIIFQSAVNVNRRFLRRVTGVEEFIGYSKEEGGVLTRNVFKWDSAADKLYFRGNNNSYILEKRIALEHGYSEPKEIYDELRRRERIILKMMELDIVGYHEVNKILNDYYEYGPESLPFTV
ncbi:MAG: type II/IV secretion system ATPase subunit [Euryarchaeota archaeon]|nr:type II/IV secretion system ATPase subunit [Euryarchaeota archaeon]